MKYFFLIVLLSNLNYGQSKSNNFVLYGEVGSDYKGYLYFNYNNVKDSCLIKNKKFHFEGSVNNATSAYFLTGRPAAMKNDFYIEKGTTHVNLFFEKKIIQELELDIIIFKFIKQTKTSLIQNDFENFKNKFKNDKDWNYKLFNKLDAIVVKYPKNRYSGDLLTVISWDSLVDVKKLQYLYRKLDLKSQDPSTMLVLKRNIYPIESSKVGKQMLDFSLPDKNGIFINTKQYRGSILFIDFWASWCDPCRKQIPEVTKIYEKFKDKNFKILSISLDEKKDKWLLALEKEKMQWDNVLEEKAFKSEIVKKYEVTYIPNSFLIDEKGVILVNNPSMQELEDYLNKNLK